MKQLIASAVFILAGTAAFSQVLRPVKITPASTGACCGFRALNSAELPMGLSQTKENTIVFDKEIFDDANAFNGAAYKVPSAGVYQFSVNVGIKAKNSTAAISQLMLTIKAGSQNTSQLINIPGNYDNVITGQLTTTVKLAAGEEVSVVVIGLGTAQAATTGNLSYFSGVKLY
jgi:C1q domain